MPFYSRRELKYIDALFSQRGRHAKRTEHGRYQQAQYMEQVVLYIASDDVQPITINSFVVFLRLYWFEKRFSMFQRLRRTGSIAKTLSKVKTGERDLDGKREELPDARLLLCTTRKADGMTDDTASRRTCRNT